MKAKLNRVEGQFRLAGNPLALFTLEPTGWALADLNFFKAWEVRDEHNS